MEKPIRVRIAPSPTGDPHVGTAYVALFNYAFAKSQNGSFVLRIEDTDQQRSTKESENSIFESLRWLGLEWDEGPDKGGNFGPYRQSERTEIYREYAQKLLDAGHAYYCFCTSERLDTLRKSQQEKKQRTKYDGFCSQLSKEEVTKKLQKKTPYVIRMKVPDKGACEFEDILRGKIILDYETIDQQILIKSDGYPTYHLANVVDDHLMGISHVIRGEEWINSAPKHLLLYSYFAWEAPVLCHLPLLRNPDKSKLSKRKNPTSINYYRRVGILPQALVNFLGTMGWAMPNGKEKFSLQEMLENFDLKRITLGGPVFDMLQLKALNGKYIREDMSSKELLGELRKWIFSEDFLEKIVSLTQKRMGTFSDFIPLSSYLFNENINYDLEHLCMKDKNPEELKGILQMVVWEIEKLAAWEVKKIYELFQEVSEKLNVKFKHFVAPFFVAISGKKDSLPIFDSMFLLGKDLTRIRILEAISLLDGGLKGKALKRVEKQYKALFGS